jgi:hypothetical protein
MHNSTSTYVFMACIVTNLSFYIFTKIYCEIVEIGCQVRTGMVKLVSNRLWWIIRIGLSLGLEMFSLSSPSDEHYLTKMYV